MKILHVVSNFAVGNGAARLVASLILEQIDQGHQTDVLALIESPLSYAKEVTRKGAHYKALNNGPTRVYNFLPIFQLIPVIKRYDIIHVHLFPGLYWVLFAKILSGAKCKLVTTEHSTENNRQGKKWLKFIERFVYNHYKAVIAISEATKEYLIRFVNPETPIITIDNGINISDFESAKPARRQELGIPNDVFLLTQVARFNPQKKQELIIESLLHLPDKCRVMFIGEGVLMEKNRQLAKDLGVDNRCYFLGVREDVPSLLKTADVVIMSSNFEGFGLAAVEGMAAGKPVMASNVPGLCNVVEEAGILFPVNDEKALAEGVLRLLNDKDYREIITKQCIQRAKNYDIKVMADKYEEIYKAILQ